MQTHPLMSKLTGQSGRHRQGGALTLFSAVLVLILMTLMLFYAARVSLFETRSSSNEVRQKQAFSNAESAVDWGIMYVLKNGQRILSARTDEFPDGGGGTTGDGWFSPSNLRWQQCLTNVTSATHPCGGDFPMSVDSFYYDDPGTGSGIDSLISSATIPDLPNNSTARMSMVLCFIDFDNPAGACLGTPGSPDAEATASLVIWMLGYGYSDCTDITDVSTCLGKSSVAKPISNWRALKGSPTVPFVARPAYPPSGTVEIVGNPNGGGVAVPLTTWLNTNTDPGCTGTANPFDGSSASWQTCEFQEWYHTEEYPEGVACTDNNCQCGSGGNDIAEFLSWRKPGGGLTAADCNGSWDSVHDVCTGLDIIIDPEFPCDLFEFYFGYTRDQYQKIMNLAEIVPDCTGLSAASSGLIWVTGDCTISTGQVGTPDFPVVLITAGDKTEIIGNVEIFGLVYIFDGVAGFANEFKAGGGATVYGSVVLDSSFSTAGAIGTFQVVHADGVNTNAAAVAGIGGVNGGWRDFGLPDIAW